MSATDRDTTRIVRSWLDEGATRLPDHVLDAVLDRVPATPQRRITWWPARRLQPMNSMLKYGLAAAVIAIAALLGYSYFVAPNVGSPGLGDPTPTPIPTLAPSPSVVATIDTAEWVPFTSKQYGLSVGHPADWTVDPADRAWDLDTDGRDFMSPATDDFYTPGSADGMGVRVSVWSVPSTLGGVESVAAVEAWYEDVFCPATGTTSCTGVHDRAVPLCVEVRDCHPGILLASPTTDTQAFFTGGFYNGEIVVVSMWRSEGDRAVAPYGGAQRLLEGFLSTMCVWPEDARPEPPPPCLAQEGQ
jgi:hypothetical protein